ncbi:MAG: GrpB family protein [Chloroflexi bacterium]|nr:GrpB family protein [Chloroflexota bacterium]
MTEDLRDAVTSPVVIVDYEPNWPAAFEQERARIVAALGNVMEDVVAIEHVGSTAVPGLAAKPIIDIMIGVRKLADGEQSVEPLVGLGYEYLGEYGIPGRFYFRKGSPRSHHVHLVHHNSDFWERHLLFRDLLREQPGLRDEYDALAETTTRSFIRP